MYCGYVFHRRLEYTKVVKRETSVTSITELLLPKIVSEVSLGLAFLYQPTEQTVSRVAKGISISGNIIY